jgi:hypothetical protein
MSKLLQYLVNKPSVQHKVLPGLRKMQMAGQYTAERDATSVNTPILSKMFGAQREVDVNKLNEDSFKQKYKMTPHQYKMSTDSDYAQAFERQMDDRRQNDPNYSEINLPATDVRSKLYRGNPNLALIPKGSTGPARAQQEQLFADMTSLSAPLLPVKSLVRGLQVGKAASAAPKIIDKLISTPSPIKTAATQSVDDSGLIINDEVYRQWSNARRDANIPESRLAIRSSPPPQSMEAWGTGNWNPNVSMPADNIQLYRPVWPGTQLRNSNISPLNLSSFVEDRADRLIGATRKIDEKLGKLFSKKTNAPAFNPDEVTRLINENLSKGVGVKKENLGLQVRNSPLPYDTETGFRLETLIDNNIVGSILFQRNMTPYKPKTFSQILLDKLPTPFERWQNTPGFKKTNDFPFQDYNPINPIKDPTGKTFNTANDLYSTGISGEFNKAVNEALKAKGLGNVLSGGTGHSMRGEARWKKLVEKGLAEDLGDGYFKLKKLGGPILDPRGQWAHPGKVTRIPSPNITMQGVPYPVLGIGSNGQEQIMQPGQDYNFGGASYVDEYPMMRNGGGLLSKTVSCSNCGHSWKGVEGGIDPLNCHKCGGLVKMQRGGKVKKNPYTEVNSTAADIFRSLIPLPDNAAQMIAKVVFKDARMSNNSLSDDQKLILWNTIQNAKKRSGVNSGGGTEYQDYGDQGYGSSDEFNQWFNRGKIEVLDGAYKSLTNPGFKLASTIGRGRYWQDPDNPDDIQYTDVYDWNPSEANFKGSNAYQLLRNKVRSGEDKNLNKDKNDSYRMNFKLSKKEIEEIKKRKEEKDKSFMGLGLFKSGGQHGGLDRWFAEKWVDVKTGKACGRQEGESRAGYPACRPSKRVNSQTPKTSSEMSSAEKAKFKSSKTSSQRIDYNHKRNK